MASRAQLGGMALRGGKEERVAQQRGLDFCLKTSIFFVKKEIGQLLREEGLKEP